MSETTTNAGPVRRWLNRLVRRVQCAAGFHAWIHNTPDGSFLRVCRRCRVREQLVLVDFGRTKEWMPYDPPNSDYPTPVR